LLGRKTSWIGSAMSYVKGRPHLHSIPLPRILLLMSFWGQLYLVSKYGFEVEFLASAKQLFKPEEAKLAVQHADECYQAANTLRYLDKDRLKAIIS